MRIVDEYYYPRLILTRAPDSTRVGMIIGTRMMIILLMLIIMIKRNGM